MFDFFRSREKSSKYLITGLLSLVALSMVITLIPGFGSGATSSGNDGVVAEIGKDAITMREVQMKLNDTIRGRSIPPELVAVYTPQIIDQIVKERAMAYYAKELGYNVTDADVSQVIQMQVPQLFEGGKFIGKEAYQQFLASNNTSITEFEKNALNLATQRRMESAIMEGMVVTPEEIEKEYRARNEKVKLDFVKLDPAKIQSEIKVTPEEVNAHWLTSKANYKIPEKRAFRMAVVDEAKVSESMKMNDAQLLKIYNDNKDTFRAPEKVRARHILIKTMEKPKEQEEALKKKAEDLLKQLKAGADFAELAKKNSEDTGSAVKGGDLDFFPRGMMAKPFEEVAFKLKPKEISDVVKTEFGFHIIQTTDKQEARLKPFEEVKDQIQKEMVKQQVMDKIQQIGDQLRAAAAKNPENLEQIAQQFNVNFYKVDKAAAGDAFPNIGAVTDFSDAMFNTAKKKGDVTDLIQAPGNKLVVGVLDEIIPSRQAELSEVESQIRNSIQSERAQRLLAERSAAMLEKTRAAGGDLRKAAAGMNLTVGTTNEFGPDGNAEGIGGANALGEAFRRDVGTVFGPINVAGVNYICKVVGKVPADMSKMEAQRFDLLLRLKSKKAQGERRDLFQDGLIQYLKAKGVVKIHDNMIKRLVDSFKNT